MKEAIYGQEAVGGVLGATLGESPSEATARIEEAKKGATDLTGFIKRKKPTTSNSPEISKSSHAINGKHKVEDDAEDSNDTKKTKIDDHAGKDSKFATVEDATDLHTGEY